MRLRNDARLCSAQRLFAHVAAAVAIKSVRRSSALVIDWKLQIFLAVNVALDGERLAVMREQMQCVSAPCSLGADTGSARRLHLWNLRVFSSRSDCV